jgi:hypothetical protein
MFDSEWLVTGRVDNCRRHVAFAAEQPEKRRSETREDQQMSATLKLTHKAIGAEVRRGTYDFVVDGQRVGSVEMNNTIEIPVEPGRHTLQVRNGRNLSSTQTFDAAEGEIVAFRCTGKRFLPIFLASFVVPRLALNSFAIEPASPPWHSPARRYRRRDRWRIARAIAIRVLSNSGSRRRNGACVPTGPARVPIDD